MFGGNAYLFAIIKYFSFAFFLFTLFATQLFSTPVSSSNLRNQAPLFMELRLLQATPENMMVVEILHATIFSKNAVHRE